MRTPPDLIAAFRGDGLKVTPQRQLLFRLLHGNTGHPTAETLFDEASREMPGISLRTVYQTLNDLTAMGELQSFDFGTGAARFDPNIGSHHHVVCRSCSSVADVYVDGVADLHISELDGFAVESSDIVFRGLCATCASQSAVATDDTTTIHPTTTPKTPQEWSAS